ncbi:hypothetical protein D3C73_1433040 [compost metagenome]
MQLTGNPYPFLSLSGRFDLGGELEQAAAGFFQLKMLFAQFVIKEQCVNSPAPCAHKQLIQGSGEQKGKVHNHPYPGLCAA